ncbi:hypothetical protein EVAR_22457_1 [Eumeta japonica]|uniref:DUF7869 domain-containing protein n=1 Tax=Eumeta variegata TaxID=151549 RepID=A0A4C1VF90_EUMVA|nr:hypothetical protein EVAR_22457_1 [Eumeta japonica]
MEGFPIPVTDNKARKHLLQPEKWKRNLAKTVSSVRLIADGCTGQNENSTLLAMCSKWLTEAPKHVKCLEVIFPVVGHSYIPPDRVFALIEKEVKKREIIANPQEYLEIISQFSSVIHLGTDCKVFDWKDAMTNIMKPVGALSSDMNPKEIPPGNNVSSCKAVDVRKLLIAHYGDEWQNIAKLNFFVPLLSNIQVPDNDEQCEPETQDISNIICEPQEENDELIV